jgi:hypothetical protein
MGTDIIHITGETAYEEEKPLVPYITKQRLKDKGAAVSSPSDIRSVIETNKTSSVLAWARKEAGGPKSDGK